MTNPVLSWRRYCGFAVLLLALTLTSCGCHTINRARTPVEVTNAVATRTTALADLEKALTAGTADAAMIDNTMAAEQLAWETLFSAADSFTAPGDMRTVLQSQKVGVKVARSKIAAGEYSPAETIELVQQLRSAWAGLHKYYNPEPTDG